jgi:hypothetical protein
MKNKYTLRTVIGLTLLILFGLLAWKTFSDIQTGKRVAGAPETLQRGYLLNQKVWEILRSNQRTTSGTKKSLKGKAPRVNGNIGLLSPVDLERYSIVVLTGDKSLSLPLAAIRMLPKTFTTTEFRCIEGWSEDLSYAGVKFSEFMRVYNLGKKSDGTYYGFVGLETPDGKYYVSIDMESMLHEQTILTYEMNEMPLSLENGAPLRLIIPVKYGIKSLKRIGKIIFSDQKPRDYWAERGYDWYSGL